MAMAVDKTLGGNILKVTISGKLHKEDYLQAVPEMEAFIAKHGTVRIVFAMEQFEGWDLGAIWEDTKFDIKHFRDIEKLAMVGEKSWEEWMAKFCKPFTKAEIRYFDTSEMAAAEEWIKA
jgi:hypothetical protein